MSAERLVGLLLILLASIGWALWRALASRRLLATLAENLDRAEVLGREQAARLAALQLLQDRQQLAEHAIATSTAVVKEMHKGIADIPFSVLEAIPGARAPARLLRGLHDSISDGVYGALGNLNKAVGRELRKGMPLGESSEPAADELPALDVQDPQVPVATPLAAPEPALPAPPAPKSWG